jgi:hypothetical protein
MLKIHKEKQQKLSRKQDVTIKICGEKIAHNRCEVGVYRDWNCTVFSAEIGIHIQTSRIFGVTKYIYSTFLEIIV